jgi:4-amino-4-deoxy-L-arabinose transferase-like glycosyltransferase
MTRRQFWLALAAVVLYGRIFQTQVLWAEEGLPLAVAQQMLGGASLYRDVWFDKPPLLAWFYVGVLKLAGYSGYGLRLIGVLYILAVAAAGYGLARRLDGEPAARWTAFFLAFFTCFYVPSATVPLAADLLLVLPHLGAFWLAAAGRPFWSGALAGAAMHLNPKAALVALAAALAMGGARRIAEGFAMGAGAGVLWMAVAGSLEAYSQQVWRWGAAYAGAPFSDHPWKLGITRTLAWLGFHAALAVGPALRRERRMLLWLAASFAGVVMGARFAPRYYFQILPPLAVAAGMAWAGLVWKRRLWLAALAALLSVPAVRFGWTRPRDTALDADSRRAAAVVARLTRPEERIFVWGFRPEIYYYARRRGASRYLESQPLTGVLADRHLERSDPFRPEWAEGHRRVAEAELRVRRPAVIVDGLGRYNPKLAIPAPLVEGYGLVEETAGCRIYGRYRPLGGI